MYHHGYHDLGPDMHVPTPGRVQYYRAEALPFVPAEIKTQLRFPKAYAQSEINLRYLDKVTELTQEFMKKKINQNYFTGEGSVSMSATLSEVEVLNSAGENVKNLAQSGALKDIHERCDSLKEASESQYINMRDKIESIIQAIQTKEDDVYESLTDDELVRVSTHEVYNSSLLNIEGMASVTNLATIGGAIKNAEDKKPLEDAQNKLVALLGAKVKAMEALIQLQQAYADNVEPGDAAAINDLGNFSKKCERYTATLNSFQGQSSETAELLSAQIQEVSSGLASVSSTFSDFATATAERNTIFSNFSGQ